MTEGNPKQTHKSVRRQIPDWERRFQCPHPMCGKRFTRKFSMTEHIKTHTGDKPHECPVPGCGKKFTTAGNLARHRKIHDGYKENAGGDESPSSSTSSTSNNRLVPRASNNAPNSHIDLVYPKDERKQPNTAEFYHSGVHVNSPQAPPVKYHQKRRSSLPATLQGFNGRYKSPVHMLHNNNNHEMLFADPETLHRQKMEAIRSFETGEADKQLYFDPYAQPSSSSWMQTPPQNNYMGNYLKHTRSQSLTHEQLSCHLQAMQSTYGGFNKIMESGRTSQPQTDVDFLLQEDEDDNQNHLKASNNSNNEGMFTKMMQQPPPPQQAPPQHQQRYAPEMHTQPMEFSHGYTPLSDTFFDDNAIIDMLFDDRGDLHPQTNSMEPAQVFHHPQPVHPSGGYNNGATGRSQAMFDEWKAQDHNQPVSVINEQQV
ncbi:hypothetical protein AC1031_015695 [Aphanomyces cochlioides]|nr:hypothetical protein AC1031_015695 [Aphanomyces cochlioides]